jgi:hypothetical protein
LAGFVCRRKVRVDRQAARREVGQHLSQVLGPIFAKDEAPAETLHALHDRDRPGERGADHTVVYDLHALDLFRAKDLVHQVDLARVDVHPRDVGEARQFAIERQKELSVLPGRDDGAEILL